MNEQKDHSKLDEELKNLDNHVSFNQNRIKELENNILCKIEKDEKKYRLRDILGYAGSVAVFAVSVFVAFLIFSNTSPIENVERVSGDGALTKFMSHVDPMLLILIGMIGVGLMVYMVIKLIRKKLGFVGPVPLKYKVLSIIVTIIAFIILWISGILGIWIEGINYVHGKVDRYSFESSPVQGEFSVEIDLSDFDSNKGKVVYNDGENQIYVSEVLVHGGTDYQVSFRSSGTYNLNGATLVSGVEHAYSQGGFTNYDRVNAIGFYRGESFELGVSHYSGLNYRDGDDFGFYLFSEDQKLDIDLEEAPIIEVTITNLVMNKWYKDHSDPVFFIIVLLVVSSIIIIVFATVRNRRNKSDNHSGGDLMKKTKTKRYITIALVLISFGLLAYFGVSQYKENVLYESYLSFNLENDISALASSTVMNSNYLEDILEENQITKEQLGYLRDNYIDIFQSGEKIVTLAETWLKRMEDNNHFTSPYPVYMATNFSSYLMILEEELGEDYAVDLSTEYVERFELMKSVNDEWREAILNNITGIESPIIAELENGAEIITDRYRETYKDEMINSDDWINMIEQMQRSSTQYERDVEFFNN
ncbi:hypothetical protein [Ornithinibacillus halotolerans]|uniref:Uncharacterized protein n=1 Tax=Ornithinibacillus halotolerans TaxID=1274357 RepID=A0A916RLC0_9BACI|nr:hypothetical protein [Ornithinibacillus halotolerans]GGA60557.1 hypothetical protein GCM10008025_00720 [Ornithinibacillus halotolerans]